MSLTSFLLTLVPVWTWHQCFLALHTPYRYGRLIGNLIGKYLYRPYPVLHNPKYTGEDVTVLVPTITDDMEELRPHFLSILATPIHQFILVTTHNRKAKLLAFARELADPRIKVHSVPIANKRTQLAAVIPKVTTDICILVDDDVTWTRSILPWLLAPFENPRNGSVGVGMGAIRIRSGPLLTRCINFLGAVYLERRNFEGASTLTLDGGISCMSGRTNALRTCILQDESFLNAFCHETFNGIPLATGDDKMITRWLVQKGWGMYVQYHPEAQLLTTLETGFKFLYQCQRWAGSSWRGNYTSLFVESNPWAVFRKQPWTFYAKYIAVFTSMGLITDPLTWYCYYQVRPLLDPASIWAGNSGWVLMCFLYLSTKAVKLERLFRAHPRDLGFLPVSILFGLFHGFIKMKAFCKDQGWLTR
jgi:cellulose synthase/poly-beta-1,6-N-acetylglucosamine synthase-like glycosyltransferase